MSRNQFNPSDYPKIFQPSIFQRILIAVSGGIALVFGVALSTFSYVLWVREPDTPAAAVMAALALSTLIFSAKLLMESLRSKLILMPDAIESHGAFHTRILHRDEIEGYTRSSPWERNTPAIEFWPKPSLPKAELNKLMKVKVFLSFTLNTEIESWISGLKNLDEEESKSGVFIYSSPASFEALTAPNRPKWFKQVWIIFPTAAALLVYSMIAAKAPDALEWIDQLITPMVNSLRFIGLGITKPFMDGPMPERFYSNLVGLGVWGVVAYNTVSLWWMTKGKGLRHLDGKALWQRMKVHYGPIGSWFAAPAILLLYLLLVTLCTLALLNSINGWSVFHVKDFITPPFVIMAFAFPGAFIAALYFALGKFIVLALLNKK